MPEHLQSSRRVAVVTGATHGIGRALALEFRRRDFTVYGTGRDENALRELIDVGIHAVAVDVTDEQALNRLALQISDEVGKVDVLVNNAGYGLMGPTIELRPEQIRHQFEVNTFAPVAVARVLLPSLIAASGTIVNVTSVSGVLATPFAGAYCASKAAANTFTDSLRMELGPLGVHVLVLQPGHIASDFGATATALVDRDWTHSRYAQVREAIAERAGASQHNATPAADFARKAVDHITSTRPRAVVTLGRGGRSLVFLARFVPAALRDRLLTRRFHLTDLVV